MPPRKRNESEFGAMMREHLYWAHKWRDRGYPRCPQCGRAIVICPYCHGNTLMPKAQTYPDFIFAERPGYAEAKEGGLSFSFDDVTPNQWQVMGEAEDAWLFLQMGAGRAPDGRDAFLIPWQVFFKTVDDLRSQGIQSICYQKTNRTKNPAAMDLFSIYCCAWEQGGWIIPREHIFWFNHPRKEDDHG